MKRFDALAFLSDHGIDHTTQHQKCTKGHVNIHCPFCAGSQNYHLGIHQTEKVANCWRCGGHSIEEIVKTLLNLSSWGQAYYITGKYDKVSVRAHYEVRKGVHNIAQHRFRLPKGVASMADNHRRYLKQRRFNDRLLERIWDLQGIGPIGDSHYRQRIIIPIHFNNRIVSYQGRDITGKREDKYRTCKPDEEVIHHKHILYGLDKAIGDTVVVVEGVSDVWRLGPGSVATFGIKYKKPQIQLLSSFKTINILFDNETQAQVQAEKLADDIDFISDADVYVIDPVVLKGNDPGKLGQLQANKIMRDLLIGVA